MEGFGIDKLLLILVIVLVLFGARRVPEIGASIGKGIREFKRGMKDIGNDLGDVRDEPKSVAPPVSQAEQSRDSSPEPKRLLQ